MLSASLNDTPLYLLAGTFRQFRTLSVSPSRLIEMRNKSVAFDAAD